MIVDDGGYGILREYQTSAYGRTHAVDLVQPDFAAVAEGFGVPSGRAGRRASPRRSPGASPSRARRWCSLRETLRTWEPTA